MFPLVSLPQLAFDNVYKYFTVPEIISISECSKRVKAIIQSQEPLGKSAELSVDVRRKYSKVKVCLRHHKKFIFHLCSERDSKLAEVHSGDFTKRHVGGGAWKVAERKYGWLMAPRDGGFSEDVVHVVQAIRNLFRFIEFHVNFNFLGAADFEKLLVATDTLHRANSIYICVATFSHWEMEFMLDHFVTEKLTMYGHAGPAFVYKKQLSIQEILLYSCGWATPEMLFKWAGSCRQVNLWRTKLITGEDLNQVIKTWLASDNRTLEVIELLWGSAVGVSDTSAILDGIPTIPGAEKRPDAAKYYNRWAEYENGRDIRRADGLLATMACREGSLSIISFTVWHDPNPNV